MGADGAVDGLFGAFAAVALELVVVVDELGAVEVGVDLEGAGLVGHELRQGVVEGVVGGGGRVFA